MIEISENVDLEYALSLQQDLDQEDAKRKSGNNNYAVSSGELATPMSVVDDSWELIDPIPDVRQLFLQFNDVYFNGLLASVEVRWSPRMTLCAGLCCYEGRGGLCSIRLSEPLLKLRPRKDLVQTLLHEMIHALLFVTQNNKDHDAHGPEFLKHMQRINAESGAKITVYHNFHDEVNVYRQHWWKCDGPCQRRPPYYGMVKRSMNRAPSPRDPWWADHQRTCGGTYTKIKEPENYGAKKTKSKGAGRSDFETGTSHRTGNVPGGKDSGTLPKLFKRKTRESGIESSNSESDHDTGKERKIDSLDKASSITGEVIKAKSSEAGSSRWTADVVPFSGLGRTLGSSSVAQAGSEILSSQRDPKKNRKEKTDREKMPVITIKTPSPSKPKKNLPPTLTIVEAFQRTKDKGKHCKNKDDDTRKSPLMGSKWKPIELGDSPAVRQVVVSSESVCCPVCRTLVLNSEINQHLDSCLE